MRMAYANIYDICVCVCVCEHDPFYLIFSERPDQTRKNKRRNENRCRNVEKTKGDGRIGWGAKKKKTGKFPILAFVQPILK